MENGTFNTLRHWINSLGRQLRRFRLRATISFMLYRPQTGVIGNITGTELGFGEPQEEIILMDEFSRYDDIAPPTPLPSISHSHEVAHSSGRFPEMHEVEVAEEAVEVEEEEHNTSYLILVSADRYWFVVKDKIIIPPMVAEFLLNDPRVAIDVNKENVIHFPSFSAQQLVSLCNSLGVVLPPAEPNPYT